MTDLRRERRLLAVGPLAMIDLRRDRRLLALVVAMGVVTAGIVSYVVHPVTLLAPVPLLAALLYIEDARLRSPVWIVLVASMMTWTVLLYLAMDGSATALVHGLAMCAPFAALAFRVRRVEPIALVYAVVTATLVTVRMVGSFLRAGAEWRPWQVYEGNELSARLNVLLPLVVLAYLAVPSDNRRARRLLCLLFAAGVVAVGLAQQRAGLAVGTVLILIGLARMRPKALLAVGAAALAAGLVASGSIHSLLERTRFAGFTPMYDRPEIWGVAIDGWRGSSWLGVGPGNSDDALREVGGGHAHNSLLQTGLETGWPGALLLGGLAVYVLVLAARLLWRGGHDTLWALSLLGYVGFSLVSSPIQRPDFSLALVLVILAARQHVAPGGRPCVP